MLLQFFQFSPFVPLHSVPPFSPVIPSCSSPWVMHVSSLAFPFPIPFSTSPCLFCTYQFVLLNPCTFYSILPFPLPIDNLPNDLHIYDFVPVLLVCLVYFLDSVVDSCEFIAILMFIVLIFFLNKSL